MAGPRAAPQVPDPPIAGQVAPFRTGCLYKVILTSTPPSSDFVPGARTWYLVPLASNVPNEVPGTRTMLLGDSVLAAGKDQQVYQVPVPGKD